MWALSPLGVYLSEYRYSTPAVFWKLFPSAVLLLMAGLVGLYVQQRGRSGMLEKAGFAVAFAGLVLVLAGDVGKFWLNVDDVYLMTAPAYRTFRLGLVLLAAGSLLLGFAAARAGRLPVWIGLPFAIASLAGLISVSKNLGYVGATMWIIFGVGWVWLGLAILLQKISSFRRKRRSLS